MTTAGQGNPKNNLANLRTLLRHPPRYGDPPRIRQIACPPEPIFAAAQKKVTLSDGRKMPVLGLGLYYAPDPTQVEEAVRFAIQVGYRHFDWAWIQGIDEAVGRAINGAIRDRLVTRQELFLSTKLWNNFHDRESVSRMLNETLEKMNLDYIDLYLIHWPMSFRKDGPVFPAFQENEFNNIDYVETWRGMEDCVYNRRARSIGVVHFNIKQFTRILMHARIRPVVLQIEVNPWFNNASLIELCRRENVLVQACCPLGINEIVLPGNAEPSLKHPQLAEIGERYGTRTEVNGNDEVKYKTQTQVVLNWLVKNKNLVVVPKSVTEIKMYEYLGIFDFTLTANDVQYLDSLNVNNRSLIVSAFWDHHDYPFEELTKKN